MNITRREFLKESLAALGFLALPGGWLFAAPPGWKPQGKPNLVFGVVSDTHLRTSVKGNGHGAHWPDKYLVAALKYFKEQNVDAVVHCGDMAHRGQTREMEFHAEAWKRVFGKVTEGPVKLFVTGNHDVDGARYYGFVEKRYPDPVERAKHVLATDMAANWERIWGEKYEPVWLKEVKGYRFVGRNWGTSLQDLAEGLKKLPGGLRAPVFYIQHRRPLAAARKMLLRRRNVLAFFGHNHWSASNWNVISLYQSKLPCIQCASCEPRGCDKLERDDWISKAKLRAHGAVGKGRQGYVVRVYDDKLVIERREFGAGGSLGADWVMPLGKYNPHPFSKGELRKVIGEPQFRTGAKLVIDNVSTGLTRLTGLSGVPPQTPNPDNPVNPDKKDSAASAPPRLCVKIPRADGNPDSRVYAYEVEVAGDESAEKLLKAIYAAGCNLGIGHEPDGGVTTLEIPKTELPHGKALTVSVTPLTSLGTRGKPLTAEFAFEQDKNKNEGNT